MLKKDLKNDFLSKIIDEMAAIDQSSRKNALGNKTKGQTFYNHIVYLIDFVNGKRIKSLIKKYGYPKKSIIGEKTMRNFWLLIQHQDFSPELQKNCLKNCDFEPRNKAYLTDRILVNSGKKQLYGTQFYKNEKGEMEPHPIEDEANIGKRRQKMGLEPLFEYAKQMREINKG
jgi:hypothetical protein